MTNKKLFSDWDINKLKKWFLYWLVVGLGTFILFFLVTTTWIGYSVKEKCDYATGLYGGSCVEALMLYVQDDTHTLRERNRAVWALGQLGDEKALPVLKKYYTGEACQHDKHLCQYELRKAIKLIESHFNISAFVWRNNLF